MTIENLRKKINISQSELAEQLGVTQGAISQWEKGITSPVADKLPELARILQCEISDLFEDETAQEVRK